MGTPSAAELNPIPDDLDGRSAVEHFLGKNVVEAERLFATDGLVCQEDLQWMGPVAFVYYLPAAVAYVASPACTGDGDFVAALGSVVRFRLEHDGAAVGAALPTILRLTEVVLTAPERFFTDSEERAVCCAGYYALRALATETPALERRTVELARADPTGDGDQRWACVHELHRRGSPSTCAAALEWCASPEPLVRALGADVLGQLGWPDTHPYAERARPALGALLADPDPTVVGCALVALAHLGGADVAQIAGLAVHSDAGVRRDLAYALGPHADDPRAVDTLIALVGDPSAEVRDWAAFGLAVAEVDTPELRDALAARLDDPCEAVRLEAVHGLAARHDARVADALAQFLAGDEVPTLALEAAVAFPRPEFVAPLERLAAGASPQDEAVLEALERCRRA